MIKNLVGVLGFLAGGCALEEVTSTTEQAAGCGKYLCGNNSPHAGAFEFYELAIDGTPAPNSQLRIKSFRDALGKAMQLDVQKFHLQGIRPDHVIVRGPALVGSTIVLETPDKLAQFEVRLDSFANTQRYYEDGDDGTKIPSYGMSVTDLVVGGSPRRLCPIPHDDTLMFQLGAYDALIYRGDRYDAGTGDIYATGAAAGPWFNIACAGDSLAKLLVARHAEAAQNAWHKTAAAQRTAMLRMFRADYCGSAIPLTTLGVPLDWANVGGWNHVDQAITAANIEAIWTHDGAVCLTNPRNPAVVLPCPKPPPCTPAQIAAPLAYGDLVSINP